MARYIERVENLARILDVQETFSRDSRGGHHWLTVLQIYADEKRFQALHGEPTAESVIRFYLIDRDNPGSVISCVRMARENARTLRPLISTEMWIQLNMVYNHLRGLDEADLAEPRLARLCGVIKEACQAHTGITEGTFYRDEGWFFYELGRKLERADQTTRLLDVKYHLLLPSPDDVGTVFDVSQWNAVLRSASGFHAYRRVHPRGMGPARVTGFLLFNGRFPRSVMACVASAERTLAELREIYALPGGSASHEQLLELRAHLESRAIERVIGEGLHEFLDSIQLRLIALGRDLGQEFFVHGAEQPATTASDGEINESNGAMNA